MNDGLSPLLASGVGNGNGSTLTVWDDGADVSYVAVMENLDYAFVATATVYVFDYIITFQDELSFLRDAKLTRVKVLYLLCKYPTFIALGCSTYFAMDRELDSCSFFYDIFSWLDAFTLVIAEYLLILRVWALWRSSKFIFFTMGIIWVAMAISLFVAQVSITIGGNAVTSDSVETGLTGCYTDNKRNNIHSISAILAAVNEIQGLAYTAYAAYRFFLSGGLRNSLSLGGVRSSMMRVRSTSETGGGAGGGDGPGADPHRKPLQSPLVSALVHHNVFYYACALAFTATAAVLMAKYPVIYSVTFLNLQVTVNVMLVTRMHLQLWKTDRVQCNVDTFSIGSTYVELEFARE